MRLCFIGERPVSPGNLIFPQKGSKLFCLLKREAAVLRALDVSIIELAVADAPFAHKNRKFRPQQLFFIDRIEMLLLRGIRIKMKIVHEIGVVNRIPQRAVEIRRVILRPA